MSLDDLVRSVLMSRKYRGLYPETVRRVVFDCVKKYGEKKGEREARVLLHKMWGVFYLARPRFPRLLRQIEDRVARGENARDIVLGVLQVHSSTYERIEILDSFYKRIFAVTGVPKTIVEHACGFNPLTFFWMGLPAGTRYVAYDIDVEEIEFLNRAFQILGIQDRVCAYVGDLLAGSQFRNFRDVPASRSTEYFFAKKFSRPRSVPLRSEFRRDTVELRESPRGENARRISKLKIKNSIFGVSGKVDVVLMLKLLPVLEQEEKGSSLRVLREQGCKFMVVSFPVASISGRDKGMERFYEKWFLELIKDEGWEVQKIIFETELVFIVKTKN